MLNIFKRYLFTVQLYVDTCVDEKQLRLLFNIYKLLEQTNMLNKVDGGVS